MMRPPLAILLVAALVAGCTQFPALDGKVSPQARKAPYPGLVPLQAFDAPPPKVAVPDDGVSARDAGSEVAQRGDALRARAAAIYDADPADGGLTP